MITNNMRGLLAAIAAGAVLCTSCKTDRYTPVTTFAEPADPQPLTEEQIAAWDNTESVLHGAWADPDLHYSRSIVPATEENGNNVLTAWRGERASAQLLLWAPDSVSGVTVAIGDFQGDKDVIPASAAEAHFVRYTLSDSTFSAQGGPTMIFPDMLDSLAVFDMAPRTVRPVWVTVQVPQGAEAGSYVTNIAVETAGGEKRNFPLYLNVQDYVLPAPSEWEYHLDLWQHPSAVARAQNLEVWSDEHFAAMEPMMRRLANAGQKVITATLNKDPWNHQCYDGYENMINWTRNEDGTWSYDYTVFDRWVEMMMGVGINGMINCYSMVPWNCELDYFDKAKGETVTVKAEPGTEEFVAMWTPFLKDFKQHLTEKGWLGITNIAMDERAPEAMDAAVKLLEQCAPEMGFAIADNHKSYRKYTNMRDVCVYIGHDPVDKSDIDMRKSQGFNTTFYICCGPWFPNTFTWSEPYEAELLGWYGMAYGYDGMLRWAYNSWPADPQTDCRYGTWASGDTYMVYPYNRSSIRFERMIDGIEAAEKVRILRKAGVDVSGVDSILTQIHDTNILDKDQPWRELTIKARKALDQASEK